MSKIFRVTIDLEVDDKMETHDIEIFSDDVVDGYTLTRNDRLGDITDEFVIYGIEASKTEEIIL